MAIPPISAGETAFAAYANNYLMLTGIAFILVCLSKLSRYRNALTDGMMLVNIGAYLVLALKAYYGDAGAHKYYDWTYAGIFVIWAVIHVVKRYSKNKT